MNDKFIMYNSTKCCGQSQTGGHKRFLELAKYLNENNQLILCSQDSDEDLKKYNLHAKYHLNGIDLEKKTLLFPELKIWLKNISILKQLKKESYKKIIAFDVPSAIFLCIMNFKNIVLMIRKDLIGYDKVSSNISFKSKIKQRILTVSESVCLKKSELIIVQCEYDKNELIKRHKNLQDLLNNKIKIQINNVNPSWIVEKSENSKDIKKDSKTHVCFIGGFDSPRKGQDIFLEAALNILNTNNDDLVFDLVGGGKKLNQYKRKYSNDNIIFHGYLNNPIEILKGSDIVVVPSLADSCPNTVMEALYNGIPVIGSNSGGIPEILTDTKYIFETNSDSLQSKLLEILSNREMKIVKIKQNERRKELLFDWASKIKEIIEDE